MRSDFGRVVILYNNASFLYKNGLSGLLLLNIRKRRVYHEQAINNNSWHDSIDNYKHINYCVTHNCFRVSVVNFQHTIYVYGNSFA